MFHTDEKDGIEINVMNLYCNLTKVLNYILRCEINGTFKT